METDKLLNEFIDFLEEKGRSSSTRIAYKKDISQLLNYLEENKKTTDVKNIDSIVLQAYIDYLKESGEYTLKTISRKINSLKTFFKYLYNRKLIVKDYSEPIKHPELQPQLPRILAPLEYRALRDVARNNLRLYTMVELLLQTGITIGELSRLRLADVHQKEGDKYLSIEAFSSKPGRKVELNETAQAALNEYLQKLSLNEEDNKSIYLFSTKTGKPVLIRNIRTAVNRAFHKAGITNATVNDIRNTFIVYQLENGIGLEKLAKVVGHQKPTTTERYLDLLESRPKKTSGRIKPL